MDRFTERDFTTADVQALLMGPARAAHVTVESCVGSTNDELKARAEAGAAEGEVLIARQQTAGKGRLGRSFYSPKGTGLYVSLVLRPAFPAEQALLITTAAAVAVAEAIGALTGRRAKIKWVNDVYLEGRKVCGILAEAAMDFAHQRLRYVVLGIGVNLLEPPGGFPENIRAVAGALFTQAPPEDALCRLAAEILNRFFGYYWALPHTGFMAEYRARSLLDGLTVRFAQGSETFTGTALGVDDEVRLRVRLPDGTERCFASGEVTVEKDFLRQLRDRERSG